MRACALGLLAALWAAPVAAEPDSADYQVDKTVSTSKERDRIRREIGSEVEREAAQARREAEELERQRAEAEAAEARRPYPDRLLQARCTLCHPADNFLNVHHTLLGWHLVIGRMRWLNRAPLDWDEQVVLAGELARLRPAAADAVTIEYGFGVGAIVLPPLAGWAVWRWMRRRRRSAVAAS